MTDHDVTHTHEEDETPRAHVHTREWSPWIWIIPAAALVIVGWIVVRYGVFGGGDVTVRFSEARGLERYSPVRYRGAKVGTVQKITIDEKLQEVVVRLSMDSSMKDALRTGTQFWIVEPGLDGGGLGGLLAGTYVGISPGPGEHADEFRGREHPPVVAAPGPGKTLILETPRVGSMAFGTPVKFQGMSVGRVLGSEYDASRRVTSLHVFVADQYASLVRENSRFFRDSGVEISLGGGGISLGDASLASLLGSGVGLYTPEIFAGNEVPEGTRFELHESQASAVASAGGPHLTYITFFPGPVGGLRPGTPVQMRGIEVGHVREVRLRYLPETRSLQTPVTLEIDPRKLELDQPAPSSPEELRARMNQALDALIGQGMRATLATSLVLPGASAVSLEIEAPRGTGRLGLSTDPPTIPASSSGDGLSGAIASVNELADRIRQLPIEEITTDLRNAAGRIDGLVNDPRLDRSLANLDRALSEVENASTTINDNAEPIAQSIRNAAESAESAARTIDETATSAQEQIEPIATSLRRAAESAEAAASRAEQLMGSSMHQNYDLGALVEELTRAAEAVRALAAYLTENPDAVLKGRRE